MLPEKVRDHTTRPPGLTLRRPRSTWLPSARFGRHFLLLGRSSLPCGLRHRVAKGAFEGPAGGGIPETEGRNMHLTSDVTGLIGRECPRLSPTTPLPPFPTPRPSPPPSTYLGRVRLSPSHAQADAADRESGISRVTCCLLAVSPPVPLVSEQMN